jgi:hypothetical protein
VPTTAAIATAGIDVQADGLRVRLSFSYQHPEFSTPLAEHLMCDARLPEELGRAEVVVVEMAAASGPLLLQAFEQAQSVVVRSQADLSLARIAALRNHSTGTSSASQQAEAQGGVS